MCSVVQGRNASIERGGLEFPKQLNCSSKCCFEESGKDSNPITSQLTTLSEEKFQKALTLYAPSIWDTPLQYALALTWTMAARVGMEHPGWIPSSLHRGRLGERSVCCSGEVESILCFSAETVFLWECFFGGWSFWLSHEIKEQTTTAHRQ